MRPEIIIVIRRVLSLQSIRHIIFLLLFFLLYLKQSNDLNQSFELPAVYIAASNFKLFEKVTKLLSGIIFAHNIVVQIGLFL